MSFRFRQFSVDDSRCAMKVGTDGVLLGAWADCCLPDVTNGQVCRILDVGTGSGLVALMLAQRNRSAKVVGIDIDSVAAAQAAENFRLSPWADRLTALHTSLQVYASADRLFDVIVSNPPFFNNSLLPPDAARSAARHTGTLSLQELVGCCIKLLADGGLFSVILPAWEEENMMRYANDNGLQLKRKMSVQGRANKPVKRILFGFAAKKGKNTTEQDEAGQGVEEQCLVLEEGVNKRTDAYAQLTKDFYL